MNVSLTRPKQAQLPFGPSAKVSEVLPANSKAVREPSGIAFHPGRGTLYVVGDRGDVAEINRQGKVLRQTNLAGLGFEGVTVGPNGRVFALEEKKTPRIYELDPNTLQVKAEYEVDTKLTASASSATTTTRAPRGCATCPSRRPSIA